MKCNNCGAIISANARSCEFCGSEVKSETSEVGAALANAPQVSFMKDSLNFISEINQSPSSGFKLWAFIFPIAYVYGYGAIENTKKLAALLIIPALIVGVVFYLIPNLWNFGNVVLWIWVIFVSYLVSTRTHALVNKSSSFNIGKAIVVEILFLLVYNFALMI